MLSFKALCTIFENCGGFLGRRIMFLLHHAKAFLSVKLPVPVAEKEKEKEMEKETE
jgi:hypothetical protein